MNNATKIAVCLGIGGIGLLLLVIASGAAHPNPFFNYGTGLGVFLLFSSIILFVFGWVVDLKTQVKRRDWLGITVLLISAALFLYLYFRRQ